MMDAGIIVIEINNSQQWLEWNLDQDPICDNRQFLFIDLSIFCVWYWGVELLQPEPETALRHTSMSGCFVLCEDVVTQTRKSPKALLHTRWAHIITSSIVKVLNAPSNVIFILSIIVNLKCLLMRGCRGTMLWPPWHISDIHLVSMWLCWVY